LKKQREVQLDPESSETDTESTLPCRCRSWCRAPLIFVERKIEKAKAGAEHRNIFK